MHKQEHVSVTLCVSCKFYDGKECGGKWCGGKGGEVWKVQCIHWCQCIGANA